MSGAKLCDEISEHLTDYSSSTLTDAMRRKIDEHLAGCRACRQEATQAKAVAALLSTTLGDAQIGCDAAERIVRKFQAATVQPARKVSAALIEAELAREAELEAAAASTEGPSVLSALLFRMGGAPWWAVSAALHVLVIALAGLISMAIELPRADESVVMVTELAPRRELNVEPEKAKATAENALNSNHDTPPTDPTSKEASEIVVPPDLLAKAELGDHFETINPDRPDTQSAFGNPDAQMFHSIRGNDEPPGGGGIGGTGLDDLIGVGGSGSPGSGGGWGGGNGSGTGVGDGAGHGSFGNRNGGGRRLMVKRHGGSEKTENAVNLALEWLAYHQEPDGHWDARKYGARYSVDVGMTGLALLAFLGAGHTEKVGKYKDNVIRGVAWLKSKQNADGSIGTAYQIAISTLALAEAAGMANIPETRAAAQKAINYCTEIHQEGEGSEKGGWRYQPKMAPDISVTGWFVMALKSAKVAGLQVNPMSFDGADKTISAFEAKNVNPHGVDTSYGPPSRFGYQTKINGKDMNGADPGDWGNARQTSIGVLCRQFLGYPQEKLQSTVDLIVEIGGTPKWTDDANKDHAFVVAKTDLYYWYYATLCIFQQGGDTWKKWNTALKSALVDNQCKAVGDDYGSWKPAGCFSEDWGRVGQTALGALCLEVYYRYAQLHPEAVK